MMDELNFCFLVVRGVRVLQNLNVGHCVFVALTSVVFLLVFFFCLLTLQQRAQTYEI